MDEALRVLILEDVATDAELALRELRLAGLVVSGMRVVSEADFVRALSAFAPDLILADYALPQFDGFSAIRLAQSHNPHLPVILVSGSLGEEQAIESLKRGATDYVLKQRLERLGPVAKRALTEAAKRQDLERAEGQIRYLATVLENVSDGIVSTDLNNKIQSWNSGAEALFGYRAEEVVGRPYAEVVVYGPLDAGEPDALQPAAGSDRWQGEARVRHKDGALIDVLVAGAVLRDSIGAKTGFSVVLHDITERKQAEAALQSSEARFRALIENCTDGISLIGPDGTLSYVSPSTRRLLGYSGEELLGTDPARLIHPDDQPAVLALLAEMLQKPGQTLAAQYRMQHEDGSWRWVETTITNLLAEPSVGAIVFNYRDITERVQAEAQLRLQGAALNAAANAMMITDEVGAIVWVNPAFTLLTGYSAEAVLGQSPRVLKSGRQEPSFYERMWAAISAGQVWHGEMLNRRQDGSYYTQEQTITPLLDENGRVTHYIAIQQDVTARKEAEAALLQTNDLLSRAEQMGHIGSWELDIAADRLVWSDGLYSIYGLSREKVAPSYAAYIDRLHPDDRERAQQITEAALRRRARTAFESRIICPDGEVRVLSTRTDVIFDEQGQPTRLIGLEMDITERRRAEQALVASESELRSLFAAMTDVVLVLDSEGRHLQIAPTNPALLVRPPDDLLGRTVHEVMPAADANRVLEVIRQALETRRPVHYEYSLTIDGAMIWLDGTVSPMGLDKVFWISRDITERKQRERELEAIAAISTALRTARSQAEMMPIILQQVKELVSAEAISFGMRDTATGELEITLGQGELASLTGYRVPAGLGITGQVLASGQPYVTDELAADPHWYQATGRQPRAAACVPLITSQQVIGILWAGRAVPFTAGEVRVLSAIAGIAASAIQRAGLHEQTEQRLQRLAALRDIDGAIMNSTDLRTTLTILLGHVTGQLGVDAADILLLSPGMNVLEFAAGRGFRSRGIERVHLRLGEGHAGRAALERRLVAVPDLRSQPNPFLRAELLALDEFVGLFCVPLISKGQLLGVLEVWNRAPLNPDADWLEFFETLAGQAAIAVADDRLFADLQRSNMDMLLAYDTTLEGWSAALDLRDKETEGHSQRVTELTLLLAQALGVRGGDLEHMRRGALLHDIGKMGVPDSILLKPGKLTDDEWVIMRQHPKLAYELLSRIAFLRPALDIPYCHHEKWDGTGYPRQLKGDAIPLAARIFAVVDVWDALCSDRPYRPGWPEDKVLDYLRTEAGKHFDPAVAEAFLALRASSAPRDETL